MIIFCPVPCESGYMYDCNSGECQQCPHGSYQPQWGQTRSGEPVTRVQLYTCHVLLSLYTNCTRVQLLAVPRQHHHGRPGRRQPRHVQVALLPLLRQGGGRHHGEPQLPPPVPGNERLYLVKILCFSIKIFCPDWCGVPVARVPGPHPPRAADLAAAGAAPGLLRLLHGVQVGVTLCVPCKGWPR